MKVMRAWSSMATNSVSRSAPSTESRRLPVTRWLGRSMLSVWWMQVPGGGPRTAIALRMADPTTRLVQLQEFTPKLVQFPVGANRPGRCRPAFNVSQSIVREAFKQLAAEGFLHADPRRGVSVSDLSHEDAAELVRLRSALEVQVLRLAVPLLKAQDIKAAKAALLKLEAATSADDVIRGTAEFHDCIYAVAHQHRTMGLISLLRLSFDRYFRLVSGKSGHLPKSQSEHRRLLRLCEAGDVEGACALLLEHIEGYERGGSQAAKSKA